MRGKKLLVMTGVVCLALIIAVMPFVGACAKPAPTPTPTPTPTPAPTPAPAKPLELSFALHIPPGAAPYHSAFLPWAEEIEERTNGQIKIIFYHSETLAKAGDLYDAVVFGIADVSWGFYGAAPGRFPLADVMPLPYIAPSTEVGTRVFQQLYEKFPEVRAAHNDVHLLWLWCTMPYQLHTVVKPVRTLEDIQGMKIATPAGAVPVLKGLGAVPVSMTIPELYLAVERGVTDGVAIAWGALGARKLYEVTNYHTNAHFGGMPTWAAMNLDTWNRLPPDIQAIITEVSAKVPEMLCAAVTVEGDETIEIVKKLDQEIIELTPEEMARWVETAKPAWDKWAMDMEAKGLPGRAVVDEAVRLVEKYR